MAQQMRAVTEVFMWKPGATGAIFKTYKIE